MTCTFKVLPSLFVLAVIGHLAISNAAELTLHDPGTITFVKELAGDITLQRTNDTELTLNAQLVSDSIVTSELVIDGRQVFVSEMYVGPTRDFTDLLQALEFLNNQVLATSVTIHLDDGVYNLTDALSIGISVEIIGNETHPEACRIENHHADRYATYINGDRVTLRGVYIYSPHGYGAITKREFTRLELENCVLNATGAVGRGIQLAGGETLIGYTTIYSRFHRGIYLYYGALARCGSCVVIGEDSTEAGLMVDGDGFMRFQDSSITGFDTCVLTRYSGAALMKTASLTCTNPTVVGTDGGLISIA